jgi:hypothetical protein
MKQVKSLVFVLLTGSLLFACEKDKVDVQKYLEFSLPEINCPFSLLTREQKKTRKKYLEVLTTYLYVDTLNRKAEWNISREDFLLEGLPESYYHEIVRAIEYLNLTFPLDTGLGPVFLKELPVLLIQTREELANMVID